MFSYCNTAHPQTIYFGYSGSRPFRNGQVKKLRNLFVGLKISLTLPLSVKEQQMLLRRKVPAKGVDVKTVHSDLLCGEMTGTPLECFHSVVTNVNLPMIARELFSLKIV